MHFHSCRHIMFSVIFIPEVDITESTSFMHNTNECCSCIWGSKYLIVISCTPTTSLSDRTVKTFICTLSSTINFLQCDYTTFLTIMSTDSIIYITNRVAIAIMLDASVSALIPALSKASCNPSISEILALTASVPPDFPAFTN